MASPKIPLQYALLYRLMRDGASVYSDKLEEAWNDCGSRWNPDTARFEVDVYFLYLLSTSLLRHKQDRLVWREMCRLSEIALVEAYSDRLLSDDLPGVIAARVAEYKNVEQECARSGHAFVDDLTQILRQRILASAHDNSVEESPPFILCGIDKESNLQFWHLSIDLYIGGAFVCSLKHVLRALFISHVVYPQ